jgi:hypothetical protein
VSCEIIRMQNTITPEAEEFRVIDFDYEGDNHITLEFDPDEVQPYQVKIDGITEETTDELFDARMLYIDVKYRLRQPAWSLDCR